MSLATGDPSLKVVGSRDFDRIVDILEDRTEEASVRGQAAEALAGRIRRDLRSSKSCARHERARAAPLGGLDDPQAEVRFCCIFAVASPENAELLPRLKRLARDPARVPGWWTVGKEARWAMNQIRKRNLNLDPPEL